MTLRNVPTSFTLEQQRQEVNLIAVDLDSAVDGIQTFSGNKTFSDDVTFDAQALWGDGDQAVFGADNDMLLYHSGLAGFLENGTGDLYLRSGAGTAIHIEPAAGADSIIANAGGSVELYHNTNKKFETSSGGASVLGEFTVSGASEFSGATNLISGSNKLNFNTNTNQEGQLWANSDYFYINSSATLGMNIQANTVAIRSATGGENYFTASINNGALLYHDDVKKFETTATGVSITGNIDSVADVSASGNVSLTGVTANYTVAGTTTFNNNAAFANDKVLNFGASSDGRIAYLTSTNSFDVRVPGGTQDLKLGAGTNVRITNEDGLTDRAVFNSTGLTVVGTVDADAFTINGASLQTDVATTTSVGTVQPDGTTIGIDANGVISVTGGGDPFTADGFKFGVNESSGPAATQGEIRQIDGKPHFYDGSAWQEFILGSTQVTTIPAETAWDKVIIRSAFDSDANDVKFGATGDLQRDTNITASNLQATPAKFGTNVLKSVGNGVEYPHRAEYDFTGEWTIEFWYYQDSQIAGSTGTDHHTIVSKSSTSLGGGGGGGWEIYVTNVSANTAWRMDINDGSSTSTVTLDLLSGTVHNNQYLQRWSHIAIVKESDGTLHFYRDGVEGNTSAGNVSGNNIIFTGWPISFVGKQITTHTQDFDGFIDDLRVTTDARYTTQNQSTTNTFTPPASAHPISGTTTTYTPPPTSKAGEITLGATPTWTGTAGVTVTQQSSGNYRMTFTNPFTNATDYYVFTNHMDYIGGQVVFVKTTRSNTHIDFLVYREGDGANVDTGSIAVQVIAH